MSVTEIPMADLDARQALHATRLFGTVPDAALADLVARARPRTAVRGETLIAQGDPGDFLLILVEGCLKVVVVSASGREILLDFPGPGAVLGEIAILDGGPRTASVVAVESSRLLVLHRRELLPWLGAHPAAAIALLSAMATRMRETVALIEGDRALPMGPRLARCLLRLSAAEGGRLRVRLSQGELGAFAGLSRENVNRQLKEWEAEGIVALQEGRIDILDRPALVELDEWCG
jgi:CRP/FNR family cyclic AMP-dependent transcriptional regulator